MWGSEPPVGKDTHHQHIKPEVGVAGAEVEMPEPETKEPDLKDCPYWIRGECRRISRDFAHCTNAISGSSYPTRMAGTTF